MAEPPLWLCIHEMGHAIAHLVINERSSKPETILVEVCIGKEGNSGFVRKKTRPTAHPHNSAIRCLAGYAAELRHSPGVDWLRAERPAIVVAMARGGYDHLTDIRMAREALGTDASSEVELGRAWDAAHKIIASQWGGLVHIARLLQRRLTMTGAEVEAEWRRHRIYQFSTGMGRRADV